MNESKIYIADIHPDLLGTYGDGGNAVVLAQRLKWRGMQAEIVKVNSQSPIPSSCDFYCLGGGEDAPQAQSAYELRKSGALNKAVESGAVVLGVCAGFQILGDSFAVGGTDLQPGVGILDVTSVKGLGPRSVGEVMAVGQEPAKGIYLSGYENHSGITLLGASVSALASVIHGNGNNPTDNTEGAVNGRVIGTYLHGPVLVRNPQLADLLLSWVVEDLAPLDDSEIEILRSQRFSSFNHNNKSNLRSIFDSIGQKLNL